MPRRHPTPTQRLFVQELVRRAEHVEPVFTQFRNAWIDLVRRRGLAEALKRYDTLWEQLVIHPRVQAITGAVIRVVTARLSYLGDEAVRRYGQSAVGPPLAPRLVHQVANDVLGRRHGPHAWRYVDGWWPNDHWIKRRFLLALQDGQRRLRRLHAEEQRSIEAALISDENARVKIDPRHSKFAYPIDPQTTELELIEKAADTVVVARGQYYAVVGLREAMRAAEQAADAAAGGALKQLQLWRWTPSAEHDSAPSSPDMCDMLAEADVGFGPGLYHDSRLPQSHPECWCSLEPEWADGDADELVVPDDYEDRVDELMMSLGVSYLEPISAARAVEPAHWREAFQSEFGASLEPSMSFGFAERLAQVLRTRVPRSLVIAQRIALDPTLIDGEWDEGEQVLTLNPAIWRDHGRLGLPGAQLDRLDVTVMRTLAYGWAALKHIDASPEWLRMSGWVKSPDWTPATHERYVEERAGFQKTPSVWCYRIGAWFLRQSSSVSPADDFADCCFYVLADWERKFTGGGEAKCAYVDARLSVQQKRVMM